MTTVKEASIVLPLNEGVTEGVVEDTAGGIIMRSENTRLTKYKGTTMRRPAVTLITTPTSICGGLVNGGRDSVCAYFEAGAHQRITGTSTTPLIAPATGTAGASAYFPYPLVDSGTAGAGLVLSAPATCFDSDGNQWFLSSRIIGGSTALGGIFVSVNNTETELVPSNCFHQRSTSGVSLWVGVTPTTTGVIGWYDDGGIYAVHLTVSGTTLVVGTPTLVYIPLLSSGFTQADVTSDGANTAYLLCRDSVSGILLNLHKVNLTTLAITNTIAIAGAVAATSPPIYLCVTYFRSSAVNYVAVASSEGAGVTLRAVYTTALANVWSLAGAGRYGPVAVQPWIQNGNNYLVFATSLTGTTIGTGSTTGVIFDTQAVLTGALIGEGYVYWYGLQSKGCSHTPTTSFDTYPYFPLYARWGAGGAPPTVPGGQPTFYMDTPSIEVVTPFSPTVFTPVMRCGVDLVSQYSGVIFSSAPCAVSSAGKMTVSYAADRLDQPNAGFVLFIGGGNSLFQPRYATFDLTPTVQPSVALDTGNVAAIATGLPAVWDGTETTEYAPFHRPQINVVGAGGTGPNLTGTISYTAVVSWRDAAGNVRRSPPALPFKIVLAGAKPIVYVTIPLSMRQGERQETFSIDIYSTTATATPGTTYIATDARTIVRGTNGCWQFNYIFAAVLGDPVLYSLGGAGETLLPECPPPAWDIRAISGRLWLIDAENRYRLLPSLLKEQGIAYEFNSNLQIVNFDVQYGKLMAVVDIGGRPTVLAERGIWAISGYGPDNAGQGQSFSDPQLISNQGCLARHTVVQVPNVGVMFQAQDGRFAMLGNGLERFETFGVYDVATPTVHMLQNEIIYPLTDGTGYVVYNWVLKAWTHWPNVNRNGVTSSCTIQSEDRSRTYQCIINGISTQITYMDSDSVDTNETRSVTVERGWICPGNPQDDAVIREVWIQGLSNGYLNGDGTLLGESGYSVTVAFDYNESNSVTRTWTAAEVYALGLLAGGKITIGVNCHAAQARAVKVTVTSVFETGSDAEFNPTVLTITYGVTGALRRRALRAGALK
jgi:hypothetical protein